MNFEVFGWVFDGRGRFVSVTVSVWHFTVEDDS